VTVIGAFNAPLDLVMIIAQLVQQVIKVLIAKSVILGIILITHTVFHAQPLVPTAINVWISTPALIVI
jgi:hypothetical protein